MREVPVCHDCVKSHRISVSLNRAMTVRDECYFCPPESGSKVCVLVAKIKILPLRRPSRMENRKKWLDQLVDLLTDDPIIAKN